MERVSNRFFAHLIHDGKSVSVVLKANTTLAQVVDAAGNCTPNWNADEASHDVTPLIWAHCRLSGKEKAPNGDYVWKWNGSPITFGDNGKSNGSYVQTSGGSTYPIFEKATVQEGGISMPALRILRNLAGSSTDNDLITLDGSIESGGVPLGFSVDMPVRIQESSGSGWFGWITGEPRVTENAPSTTLSAHLKNGSEAQTSFTTKWYREGIDQNGTQVAASNGVAQKTYTSSDITDNVVVRCEFYVSNVLVDTVYYNVDDETDEMELQVSSKTYTNNGDGTSTKSGTGQGDVILREGQETLFTFWTGHRMNPQNVYSGYSKFYVKLTDNEDLVISPSAYAALLTDGQPGTVLTGDTDFCDVTVDLSTSGSDPDPVSGKGGKIRLTADFLDANGEGVGGIIIAE